MIQGIHITATLQTGRSESSNQPVSEVTIPLKQLTDRNTVVEDTRIDNILERLTKLEAMVTLPPSTADIVASETAWGDVFISIVRRLDSATSQQSVTDCIRALRDVREHVMKLCACLKNENLSVSQHELLHSFLEDSKELVPVLPADPVASSPEVSPPKLMEPGCHSRVKGNGRQSRGGGKSWGKCFYCPTEWKPGHACPGQIEAQRKKAEREKWSYN